ncbi:mechanosensitive ion channel domain-containing protein [Desulfatirhabdium butyrativorans]|uniref:mechanosensitive ion channel domain-containing protein n=1 Tax=Desulfatirhabdium butyrativorans TaxID=340467 RepID=UPI00040E7224|nr:mechanosensitive ion channel domain-containing protein [Desulfatirhabdium butyrativorans]
MKLLRFIAASILIIFFQSWMTGGSFLAIASATDAPAGSPQQQQQDIRQSIDAMLASETAALEDVKTLQKQIETNQKALAAEMNTYRMQISAYGNLLAQPDVKLGELEKAWVQTADVMGVITQQIKSLRQKLNTTNAQWSQVVAQIDLNSKQLLDIQAAGVADASATALQKKLKSLVDLLNARKARLEKIQSIQSDTVNQLDDIQSILTELAQSFEEKIHSQKQQELFQKRPSLLQQIKLTKFRSDADEIRAAFQILLSASFYFQQLKALRDSYLPHTSIALLLLILWLALVHRLQVHIQAWGGTRTWMPWQKIAFHTIHRSWMLSAITLYGFVFLIFSGAWPYRFIGELISDLLLLILFCKWLSLLVTGMDALNPPRFPLALAASMRWLIFGAQVYGALLILSRLLISDTNLYWIGMKLVGEIGLLLWIGEAIHRKRFEWDRWVPMAWFPYVRAAGSAIMWAIGIIPVVLDWTGYNVFALFWLASWGQTTVCLLWAIVLFHSLREWNEAVLAQEETRSTLLKPSDGYSARWILLRLAWIALPSGIIASILISWGAKQTIIGHIFQILAYPITIGSIRFSISGIIGAGLILLIARLVLKPWRRWIKDKLFKGSGLEKGFIDSIATLTTYVLWALAIFIALQALGVSTASLAVVFGALGIGLGFGLQNIFNNFISGIILLFERPIQVGDAIEINGTWGIVKKINFRSTQVQTYDNASLIIPNSEFISNSVTNWTFKDQRIRRIITIGVAYGSDSDLVVSTLTEIAMACKKVLKYPQPDVIFADFADSALTFKLRVWTTLDDMVSVENKLRHDIYKAFAEKGIEIPFPQQDIHIKE